MKASAKAEKPRIGAPSSARCEGTMPQEPRSKLQRLARSRLIGAAAEERELAHPGEGMECHGIGGERAEEPAPAPAQRQGQRQRAAQDMEIPAGRIGHISAGGDGEQLVRDEPRQERGRQEQRRLAGERPAEEAPEPEPETQQGERHDRRHEIGRGMGQGPGAAPDEGGAHQRQAMGEGCCELRQGQPHAARGGARHAARRRRTRSCRRPSHRSANCRDTNSRR